MFKSCVLRCIYDCVAACAYDSSEYKTVAAKAFVVWSHLFVCLTDKKLEVTNSDSLGGQMPLFLFFFLTVFSFVSSFFLSSFRSLSFSVFPSTFFCLSHSGDYSHIKSDP